MRISNASPQEEAFWKKRQAKLRAMAGLEAADRACQETSDLEGQENCFSVSSNAPQQIDWKVGDLLRPLFLISSTPR